MYRRYRSYDPYGSSDWVASVIAAAICLVVLGVIVGIIALLGGLKDPNYAGTGNDFDITATVTGTTDESVLVDHITVNIGEGQAANWFATDGGWFDANHQELQDNFTHNGKHRVGHIYDAGGTEITLKSLQKGCIIEANGRIRATALAKSSEDRAVFYSLSIHSC